jgi:hypothetical protein
MTAARSPLVCAAALAAVVAAGLGSRVFGRHLPWLVATYAGDTLYATMVVVGLALLMPRASTRALASWALAWSVAVEISQLYRAPWIDAIRRTMPGALVLGQGFLWSDLACYVVGVALGAAIDAAVLRRQNVH